MFVTRRKIIIKKGMQYEDFPGGHPSLNFGVLMGSGALVLV